MGVSWGKIEVGESLEQALLREIREEFSIEILMNCLLTMIEHTYPDFYLTMHVFLADYVRGDIVLTEHLNLLWLAKDELKDLDWAAADRPIIDILSTKTLIVLTYSK